MSIWEDVYSKHTELNKEIPHSKQQEPPIESASVSHEPPQPASSASFEEMYYGTGKSQSANQHVPASKPKPASPPINASKPKQASPPVNASLPKQASPPVNVSPPKQASPPVNASLPEQVSPPIPAPLPTKPPAPSETVNSRFLPRQPGRLTTSYPAVLAKMRNQLSDMWANIMIETKQTVNSLLICGSARGEGSTFISFHLAMYLSKEYNMRVIYVDTNLNHVAIPKIQNLPGLYSFISENKKLSSLIVQSDYPGLYLLPSGAGKIAKNIGGNMLTREPAGILIEYCRSNFDMTIIDGQPIASSAVMIELARLVDMTLLVCRYGYSRQEVCKMATDKLQKFGITAIGAILNDRRFPVPQKLYKLMG